MTKSWWANRKFVVTVITATVGLVTTVIRFTGAFESLELKRYDYFFSKRAIADWDERIVIIGYTEEDAKKHGYWLPDDKLKEVLEKVNLGQPTTIGLFFKREAKPKDLTQRELLQAQIKSMPSLVKVSGKNTFTPETDNIVRKVPLYNDSGQPHIIWAIAKHYLQSKEANITETKKPRAITIKYSDTKEVTIKPLTVLNDGGYNSSYSDLVNFQTLISWPFSARRKFKTYSFEQIRKNPPLNLKDKIVIIAERKDRKIFKVPITYNDGDIYNFLYSSEIAGLAISNILQQAEVPFVQVWSDPIEYLYFYGWLIASAIMVLWLCEELDPAKKWAKYILSIAITWGVFLLGIYTISLGAFPKTWIPSVFVGRGVSFNIVLCSLVCLELKVREEQNKQLINKQKQLLEKEKRLQVEKNLREEKEKRLQEKEILEQEKNREIAELKETLLAKERLAFLGQLLPFLRHRLLNYYDEFNLDLDVNLLELEKLSKEIQKLVSMTESIIGEDSAEDKKEYLINLIEDFNNRNYDQRDIIQKTKELIERFLPMLRNTKMGEYLTPKHLNINDIIRESSRIARFDFKTFHREVKTELKLELLEKLPNFYGFYSELQFALVNVIENAYYAVWLKNQSETMGYTPTVIVHSKVTLNRDTIQILVKDNGIGISPELSEDIFQPFFTTKKERQHSSGVGLTLARDILQQHYNGNIYLDWNSDLTCFVIDLPLDTNVTELSQQKK